MEGEKEGQEGGEEAGMAEGLDGPLSLFAPTSLPYGEGLRVLRTLTCIYVDGFGVGKLQDRLKKAGLLETHRRAVVRLAMLWFAECPRWLEVPPPWF